MATNKQWTWVAYALQAAGLVVGLTAIIGLIISYVKRDDVRNDPVLMSHFTWQIRTFWWSLLWFFIGFLTIVIGVGIFIIFFVWFWELYRVIKGMIRLSENRSLEHRISGTSHSEISQGE